MSNFTLVIWYDQQVDVEAAFVKNFSADIQKCLRRYLPDCEVTILHNTEGEAWNLYIQSAQSPVLSINNNPKLYSYIVQVEPVQHNIPLVSNEQYLLWDKHFETDEVRLYRPHDMQTKSKYWEKLTDISIAISSEYIGDNVTSAKPRVYLSLDDNNNYADRENLKRDLSDLGYHVLPNQALSSNYHECTKQIDEALVGVEMIIHIIPPIYNIHFPESQLSLTEHQCNRSTLLMEKEGEAPLRVIWISSAYEITDEVNQVFIEKIQRDPSQTRGSVVLKSSLEDLKKYYRQKVTPEEKLTSDDDHRDGVYVVADNSSQEDIVVDTLKERRVKASSNINNISYTQHLELLSKASSVVICYTDHNPNWLAVKANDILKSKGVDRAQMFDRVVLFRGDKSLDVKTANGVFTDMVDSLSDLKTIFNQSSNK